MTRTPRICQLAYGNPGIRQTVDHMWRLMLAYSPRVRDKAEAVLAAYKVQFAADALQAAALYDWVQRRLAYVKDHVLIEELRGPDQLLDDIARAGSSMGDCDDFSILLGAELASIGIPFSLATVSTDPSQVYNHVFLNLDTAAMGRLVLDPIGRDDMGRPARFGWHVPWDRVTAYEEFAMPESYEAMGMVPGGARIA